MLPSPGGEPLTRKYLCIVKDAVEQIEAGFFKLTSACGDDPIRERVFCYEFYHQFRQRMDDCDPLSMHGELDKSGRAYKRYGNEKPDFLLHQPGVETQNLIVMEVKGKFQAADVKCDIEKLLRFTEHHKYEIGLFLIYNVCLDRLRTGLANYAESWKMRPSFGKIMLMATPTPGVRPESELASNMFPMEQN